MQACLKVGRAWVGRRFPLLGELETCNSPPLKLCRKRGELPSESRVEGVESKEEEERVLGLYWPDDLMGHGTQSDQ